MRTENIAVFFAFLLASVIPDILAKLLPMVLVNPHVSYTIRDNLAVITRWPWTSVVFGLTFSIAALVTAQAHNKVFKNELFAFILICPMIAIIIQYGGALTRPIFEALHVPAMAIFSALQAAVIALAAYHGLSINLGPLGVLFLTFLGALLGFLVSIGIPFPVSPFDYWYTIFGTIIGIFAVRDRHY